MSKDEMVIPEELVREAIRRLKANPRAYTELLSEEEIAEIAAAAISAVVVHIDDGRAAMRHDQDEINSLKAETRALLRELQAA